MTLDDVLLNSLRILRALELQGNETRDDTCEDAGLGFSAYYDTYDYLVGELEGKGRLEECGCCGAHHRKEFTGDCREDAERF